MSMTRKEYKTKLYLQNFLGKQGYATYAKLLGDYDLNLTDDPSVIAYMEPSKGRIVINKNLDISSVSVVTRHEILHYYLNHEKRLVDKMARKFNLDPETMSLDDLENIKHEIYKNKNFNIAGDYEISNRAYTDADKLTVRNILLGEQILSGLVTEDEHPDWVDLTLEEMYDKLAEEVQDTNQQMQNQMNNQDNSNNSGDQGNQGGQDNSGDPSDQDQSGDGSDSDSSDSDDNSKGNSSSSQNNQDNNSSNSRSSNSKSGSNNTDDNEDNSTPQIGSKGNKSIQDKEDADREAKAKEDAEKYGYDLESDEDRQARIDRIKNALSGQHGENIESPDNVASELQAEIDAVKNQEQIAKAARDAERYANSPIKRFEANMNNFIRQQIGYERNSTFRRFNKTYTNSNIIKPGVARQKTGKIPVINVYFDRSGSWDDNKTRDGEQAISILNNYVRRNEIKMNLYYFSDHVHDNKADAEAEGGTMGQPILDHITQTHPDNVIVMTDSDISDCKSRVEVPGAVWFLFKGGRSQNLVNNLSGRQETKEFKL